EVAFIISFITRMQKKLSLKNQLVLEFGGGPALYAAASIVSFARELHFSDYLPANLQEVSKWLTREEGSFNWDDYIGFALEMEGLPGDPSHIKIREEEMRQKIKHLVICNGLDKEPIENSAGKYDFVSALYCTDIIASSVPEWYQVIRNIATLVKPGGRLMLGLTRGMSEKIFYYEASDKSFPCIDLTDDQIREGYEKGGFDLSTLYMEIQKASSKREYHNLLMTIAQKIDT
ncbi:MAG: methyltransferase domain-containing protein, partial [Spirochaetales bacterium]|nr:methyltransferase domain-containing protein [Spirochaetales bacterium]